MKPISIAALLKEDLLGIWEESQRLWRAPPITLISHEKDITLQKYSSTYMVQSRTTGDIERQKYNYMNSAVSYLSSLEKKKNNNHPIKAV